MPGAELSIRVTKKGKTVCSQAQSSGLQQLNLRKVIYVLLSELKREKLQN